MNESVIVLFQPRAKDKTKLLNEAREVIRRLTGENRTELAAQVTLRILLSQDTASTTDFLKRELQCLLGKKIDAAFVKIPVSQRKNFIIKTQTYLSLIERISVTKDEISFFYNALLGIEELERLWIK